MHNRKIKKPRLLSWFKFSKNINLFIKRLECSTSSQEEVLEWNVNDIHIILEASGNKNEKLTSLFFTVYFTKKTDKKYETSIY